MKDFFVLLGIFFTVVSLISLKLNVCKTDISNALSKVSICECWLIFAFVVGVVIESLLLLKSVIS